AVRALSPRDGFEPTSSLPTDVATGLLRANPDTTSCDGARSRPHVVGHRVSDCAVHLVPDYGSLQPGALWRIGIDQQPQDAPSRDRCIRIGARGASRTAHSPRS